MNQAVHWQKSTFSDGGDGNTCVELATASGTIHLRESDAPSIELVTTPTPSPTSSTAYAPAPSAAYEGVRWERA